MVLALSFGEVAAFVPLGTVLGFAALLLKRWWNQQDNAMAAAIEASNKEGAKCEERLQRLRERHDKDMADVRGDVERLQATMRQLIPLVPVETQVQLWDLMWGKNDDNAVEGSPASIPPGTG